MAARSTPKQPESPYMTQDELAEIAYTIGQLQELKSGTDYTSLGDIPVFDVNGEKLGTLSWADAAWRFKS